MNEESAIRRGWAWVRSHIANLVTAGRTAVTGVRDPDALREATRMALLSAPRDLIRLPEAYRQHFDPTLPVDLALTVRRDDDLERLGHTVAAWKRGERSGVHVWIGPAGSGRSTFLRLAEGSLGTDHRVVRLDLSKRIEDASELAGLIGTTLFPNAPVPKSFDALARKLGARDDRALVCLVDHLEWMALRAPGGQQLIESVLRFFSATDSRVCWVTTSTDLSWRFLMRTRPSATALARAEVLTPWNRETLEGLILARHQAGGGTLLFLESDDPAERLERGATQEQNAGARHERFFAQLASNTSQSPGQALFDWARSCEPDHHPNERAVRPYRPLSYSFLNDLSDRQDFALRACLVHGRISASQLGRVLRTDAGLASALLESLGDLALVTHDASGDWRLVPAVITPVTSHLRDRNFIF